MNPEIFIRNAEEKDIHDLNKLLFQVHKIHSDGRPDLFKKGAKKYSDEELKEILHDKNKPIFVAEMNNKIVGYAFCIFMYSSNSHLLPDIKTLYIDDFCVDENVRGQHLGTTIYKHVLDFAKKNGCYNVTLNVWATNLKAIKFYEKIGLKIQKIGMEQIL